jgi:polar amino acid transport system substrate-binding protein
MLGLTALSLPLPSRASPAPDSWQIACDDDFAPYNWMENGKLVGLDAELVGHLVRRTGAEPLFLPSSWNRVRIALDKGQVDAAFQFIPLPERFEKYHMVGPYRVGDTVFACRKGKAVAFNTLDDLAGWRIGAVQGFTYGGGFEQSTTLTVERAAANNRQLVRMLAAERVDFILIDRLTLLYNARTEGLIERFDILPTPLTKVQRYVALPLDRAGKAEQLNAALAEAEADGSMQAIRNRWS